MANRTRMRALSCALGAALCAASLVALASTSRLAFAVGRAAPATPPAPATSPAPATPPAPPRPTPASVDSGTPSAPSLAAPPLPAAREVVFLHGMGERPEEACAALRAVVSADAGALLCPRGNLAFGRGYTWGGAGAAMARGLDLAERRGEAGRPGVEPPRPGVLIAFSQGAYVAMEVLAARPGRVSAALFIGAAIHPSRQRLAKVGVSRVALAAGRYDMTYDAMRKAARALETEGVDARFFDLGPVGHTYVPSDPRVLPQVLAWLTAATAEPS